MHTERKMPSPLTSANKVARTIYRWMFSWAQPHFCITYEEFEVSVALFLHFVQSKSVVNILGQDACGDIISFAKEKVLPNAEHFVYHRRH